MLSKPPNRSTLRFYWTPMKSKYKVPDLELDDDGYLTTASGEIVRVAEYHAAAKQVHEDPSGTTDRHLAIIENFGGVEAADEAAAARQRVLSPPQKATAAAAGPVRRTVLQQATDALLEYFIPKRADNFDRQKYAEALRAKEVDSPPTRVGVYDRVKFLLALATYEYAPLSQTDEDIQQLDVVDHALGEKARAARAGFAKPASDKKFDELLADMPVSGFTLDKCLKHLRRRLDTTISTVILRAREAHARLDLIERRLGNPAEDAATKLIRLETEIAAVKSQLSSHASHPHMYFAGTWSEAKSYEPGSVVLDHSALWIAHVPVSKARPGGMLEASRAWQLIQKSSPR